MYHVQLRQFPHNVCRFNLTAEQARAIVTPWAQGDWVEIEERKWDPRQAQMTVLEGPELALDQLKMGRGWRAAEKDGRDVTEQLLRDAAAPAPPPGAPAGQPAQAGAAVDSFALGVQLAALLGPDPIGLLEAWRAAAGQSEGLTPSETLAVAERRLASGAGDRG